MKGLKLSFVALGLALALVSCKKTETDTTSTGEKQEAAAHVGQTFTADNATSSVKWTAAHKGGVAPRFGTLSITDGTFAVDNGLVTGGKFVIDINSLVVDPASVTEADKKPEELAGHLKSADFFDATKFPSATFEITSVAPFDPAKDTSKLEGATNVVSGNLTLKDQTVNVTFPAKISITEAGVDFAANFTVDRSAWNLTYGTEGDPKDWSISKDIDIALDVKAKK